MGIPKMLRNAVPWHCICCGAGSKSCAKQHIARAAHVDERPKIVGNQALLTCGRSSLTGLSRATAARILTTASGHLY